MCFSSALCFYPFITCKQRRFLTSEDKIEESHNKRTRGRLVTAEVKEAGCIQTCVRGEGELQRRLGDAGGLTLANGIIAE